MNSKAKKTIREKRNLIGWNQGDYGGQKPMEETKMQDSTLSPLPLKVQISGLSKKNKHTDNSFHVSK